MVIQYASDLHLEFPENKKFITENPLNPKGDILLLAGDIVPFAVMDKHKDFFRYVSDHFEFTYWVPGNHEYYYSDMATKSGTLNERIRSNVFLVNNISKIHNHVKFIFSTLWSKIRAAYQWQIEHGMSDFHVIKYNGYRFSVDKFNLLHEECLNFVQQELNDKTSDKSVVVTHHVPTFLNYPEKYRTDVLSDAFAVELFDLIKTSGPDYWIYGHNHHNPPDFKIDKTLLLTNQLGYVKYGENQLFSAKKYLSFETDK